MKKRSSVKKLEFKKISIVNFNSVYAGNLNETNMCDSQEITCTSADTTCHPETSYVPNCPTCTTIISENYCP